jgi:hypothetical protein
MLEEAESIRGANRRDRRPKRLDQSRTGAGSCLSQQTLDLRKRLLYGVEVRRVGRQVDQFAAPRFEQLPDLLALVGREVVHHNRLIHPRARSEYPLDVGLEENLRGRPFRRQALPRASGAHARD